MHRPANLERPLRVLALAALVSGLAAAGQAFTLIDFTATVVKMSTGAPPADGPSETSNRPRYSVSDDGCWVVFTSTAKNLISGQSDGNGTTDVFLYEGCGVEKVVAMVSHSSGSALKAANGRSDQPVISPDGAFVVFRSTADDIVPDTFLGTSYTGQTNVFLWERTTDTFVLASHAVFGSTWAGNKDSQNGVISRNPGRPFVAFESVATDILESDTNGVSDVFRYSSSTGAVTRVSGPNTGLPAVEANGGSFHPAIDGSGNCIVYESEATNLVSDKPTDDANAALDVFRWNAPPAVPVTILLSHAAGAPGFGTGALTGSAASSEASISDNCQMFAFKSAAKDLMGGQNDGNGGNDVFHARNGGDAVLVSHTDAIDTDAGSDVSDAPILSRDGNWIAYASLAKDLSPGQNDTGTPSSDVFVYDIAKDTNTLASHAVGDPKTVASAESFAPEISNDGLYVAYESDAKDLDPNQNDGNGARDVFLYNRRWNNSIVVSRRFASIAITSERQSFRPALSGNGYAVAFTSPSANLIADDPETGGLDDAFLFTSYGFLPFISVRSTESQNVLEWITPPVNYASMQAFVSVGATCPTDYTTALTGTLLGVVSPPANSSALFTDPTVYPPGTTHCYSIFVERDSGPILPGDSPARNNIARTLEAAPGPVKWASNVAAVTALAQVGIGAQNVIAVANEGGVYGLSRGPTGGFWSSGYWPFRTDFSPIQGRPSVLGLSVMGSTRTTFVGSQDGRVYAFDADRGGRVGGALWYTTPALAATPALGSVVQAGVSGIFTVFGGVGDHLLVGARPTTGPAQFFALDPATGLQRAGSPYAGGLSQIGAVSTAASVDYTRRQVYFASLEFVAGQPSLWCLRLDAAGVAGGECWAPSLLPASISGGPIERNGVVYVGDTLGQVWAFDAATGGLVWGPYAACGGGNAIKSFVLADRLGSGKDLYYATSSELCAITDDGGSASLRWRVNTIPNPTAPLLARIGAAAYVYVGASDGNLYEVDAGTGTPKPVLLRTGATIGAPAFDVRDNMLYAGSDAGAIYAVQAPLP